MAKNKNEALLQRAVREYLDIVETQNDEFTYWSVPNEGSGGNPRKGKELKEMGCRSGQPDLELCYRGFVVLVELKASSYLGSAKGRLSPNQLERHKNLTKAGLKPFVCYSVMDVAKIVDNMLVSK